MCNNYKELKEIINYCVNELDDDNLEEVIISKCLYLTSFDEIEIVEFLENFGFDMSRHQMSSTYSRY